MPWWRLNELGDPVDPVTFKVIRGAQKEKWMKAFMATAYTNVGTLSMKLLYVTICREHDRGFHSLRALAATTDKKLFVFGHEGSGGGMTRWRHDLRTVAPAPTTWSQRFFDIVAESGLVTWTSAWNVLSGLVVSDGPTDAMPQARTGFNAGISLMLDVVTESTDHSTDVGYVVGLMHQAECVLASHRLAAEVTIEGVKWQQTSSPAQVAAGELEMGVWAVYLLGTYGYLPATTIKLRGRSSLANALDPSYAASCYRGTPGVATATEPAQASCRVCRKYGTDPQVCVCAPTIDANGKAHPAGYCLGSRVQATEWFQCAEVFVDDDGAKQAGAYLFAYDESVADVGWRHTAAPLGGVQGWHSCPLDETTYLCLQDTSSDATPLLPAVSLQRAYYMLETLKGGPLLVQQVDIIQCHPAPLARILHKPAEEAFQASMELFNDFAKDHPMLSDLRADELARCEQLADVARPCFRPSASLEMWVCFMTECGVHVVCQVVEEKRTVDSQVLEEPVLRCKLDAIL